MDTVLFIEPQTSLSVALPNLHESVKICCFDFDHTLVCQKSGKTFPNDADDWKPLYDSIKPTLKKYHDDGYVLIIFTNQGGVEKKKITMDTLKRRLNYFLKYVNIPMYIFGSLAYDHYRKPATRMWEYALEKLNIEGKVDIKASVYVGDAAGRKKGWMPGKKKDFTCSDRKFARNIGMPFQTPEEFFLNQKPPSDDKWDWGGLDPVKYLETVPNQSMMVKEFGEIKDKQEMILLVGAAASGKSTLCSKYFTSYVRINRDTLNTKAKCLKATKQAIQDGKSVVIDNTNPDQASRKLFFDIAKAFNCNIRCVVMHCSKELVLHLNQYRVQLTNGKTRRIPNVAYNIYYKKYYKPMLSEGINEIVDIEWAPEFKNEHEKRLFLFRYEVYTGSIDLKKSIFLKNPITLRL